MTEVSVMGTSVITANTAVGVNWLPNSLGNKMMTLYLTRDLFD
jgi:hypothetical protein